MKKLLLLLIGAFVLVGCSKEPKIGFFVKAQKSASGPVIEDWFKEEIKYARKAAKEMGFELVEKKLTTGKEVLDSIEELKAENGEGVILCSPDLSIGDEIKNKTDKLGLKLMTVDDRLVGEYGKPLKSVHHVGIWGYQIGDLVGSILADEILERELNINKVAVIVLMLSSDDGIKERTDGTVDNLIERLEIPEGNFIEIDMVDLSQGEASTAALKAYRQINFKYDSIALIGGNDDVVIAGIKALQNNGVNYKKLIGVGINGSDPAMRELEVKESGFFATIKLSAQTHGYDTCRYMYEWLTSNKEPDLEIWTDGEVVNRDNLYLYK